MSVRNIVSGNRMHLLCNGKEYFPALIAAIDAAEQEIFLEGYIYEFDDVGEAVSLALINAARRGLIVKMHIDGFGARNFPAFWQERLLNSGVQLLFFRTEIGRFIFDRSRLRRLHRKLVVIDGRLGFIGGINILSDFNQQAIGLPPRYDYAVEVRGPVVAQMHATADRIWRRTAWIMLKNAWRKRSPIIPSQQSFGNIRARIVIRDNLRHRRDIETSYLRAIESARHEIIIANAYFLPSLRFRHALVRAAERGVRVVLMLQGMVEHVILHFATRGLYNQLLSAGVEIHEYSKGFMHAKVAVIDQRWCTIGSSNIDPFSLLLAREANIVVWSRPFSILLRTDLQRHLHEDCTQIQLSHLKKQRFYQRFFSWVSFGIARFLMGISGYGGSRYLE